MRFYVFLKLVGTLEINCFWLIVNLAVSENLQNVVTKLLSVSVFRVAQFFLDSL